MSDPPSVVGPFFCVGSYVFLSWFLDLLVGDGSLFYGDLERAGRGFAARPLGERIPPTSSGSGPFFLSISEEGVVSVVSFLFSFFNVLGSLSLFVGSGTLCWADVWL